MSGRRKTLPCPGWGQRIPVPWDAKPRDLIDCENWAGVRFRLGRAEGAEILSVVQMVSCPLCGERIPVDEDTPAGAVVEHDGKRLRLEKEFGAFVLAPAE